MLLNFLYKEFNSTTPSSYCSNKVFQLGSCFQQESEGKRGRTTQQLSRRFLLVSVSVGGAIK